MAQIFRIDNPFLGRAGLIQRICYGNAMLHFFYGIPRLVFLTIPLAYLFFHLYFINASALALASYVIPYLVLANVANSRMQGATAIRSGPRSTNRYLRGTSRCRPPSRSSARSTASST